MKDDEVYEKKGLRERERESKTKESGST